jgi:hypothetical protein
MSEYARRNRKTSIACLGLAGVVATWGAMDQQNVVGLACLVLAIYSVAKIIRILVESQNA